MTKKQLPVTASIIGFYALLMPMPAVYCQGTAGNEPAAAVMTPDLLLVEPAGNAGQAAAPLSTYIGKTVTLKVKRSNITLDGLHGTMIAVQNGSNRPLLVDGDNAMASLGGKNYKCASLVMVENCVLPGHSAATILSGTFTKLLPTALTVGLLPTVKDAMTMRQPVEHRYGPDQARRQAERSRFGKRILWPYEKSEGIIYFQTTDDLSAAAIELPVNTLFDMPDSAFLKESK